MGSDFELIISAVFCGAVVSLLFVLIAVLIVLDKIFAELKKMNEREK